MTNRDYANRGNLRAIAYDNPVPSLIII